MVGWGLWYPTLAADAVPGPEGTPAPRWGTPSYSRWTFGDGQDRADARFDRDFAAYLVSRKMAGGFGMAEAKPPDTRPAKGNRRSFDSFWRNDAPKFAQDDGGWLGFVVSHPSGRRR